MKSRRTTSPKYSPEVLAIDIGSSSARTAIFDAGLRIDESTFQQVSYSMHTSSDGRAEFDPIALLEQVSVSIDRTLESVSRLDAIAISCFWHSIMGLGIDDQPTTNVLTWADTRGSRSAASLRESSEPEQHHARTGARIHASYPLVKLRWIRDTDPDTFHRTRTWLSFPEYLLYRLTGEHRVSLSMASGTGMLDRQRRDWDSGAFNIAGIDLDRVAAIDDRPVDTLREPYRSRWPALRDAFWYPAIGDGAANNLGARAIGPQRPALMIGTTGAMRLLSEVVPSKLAPGLWQYYLDKDRPLVGGALSEGGGTLAWLYDTLRLPDPETVNTRIAAATPDQHGLTVLPFLSGQRSPDWNSDARFVLHGARHGTSSIDIVQAVMESVAYSFADIMEELKPLLGEPVEIIVTGNGVRKNRVWAQILADVLSQPLSIPRRTESSLRGAAIYALERLGVEIPATNSASNFDRYKPRTEKLARLTQARERRKSLMDAMHTSD